MRVKIDIEGMEKALAQVQSTAEKVGKSQTEFVQDLALLTQATAVKGIHGPPKTGHWYKRRGPGHRASAPGQYPATDTGLLASSINVEFDGTEEKPIARVGTAVKYGRYLELKPSQRGGRPWLTRALREASVKMRNDLLQTLKARLK